MHIFATGAARKFGKRNLQSHAKTKNKKMLFLDFIEDKPENISDFFKTMKLKPE
jgi:hypothetical protein